MMASLPSPLSEEDLEEMLDVVDPLGEGWVGIDMFRSIYLSMYHAVLYCTVLYCIEVVTVL